jgi:hypothetical protein
MGLVAVCVVSPGVKRESPACLYQGPQNGMELVAVSVMSPWCKRGESPACLYQGPQNWVVNRITDLTIAGGVPVFNKLKQKVAEQR